MINEMNLFLSERIVRLTPDVRKWCEQVKAAEDGEEYKFRTFADAWIYLVVNCKEFTAGLNYEWHSTDAFSWKRVSEEWKDILLLRAICELWPMEYEEMKDPGRLVEVLQEMAHQGLEQLKKSKRD